MRRSRVTRGFTLLELLTVMAIIVALAAMILAGVGYAQRRSAAERARAEIAALSVGIESYKIDHGDYPRTPSDSSGNKAGTDMVIPIDPATGGFGTAVTSYASSSGIFLLAQLEGGTASPRYFEPKLDMLSTGADRYLLDPFGNPYGYSTAGTFNPTFDLWSTLGMTTNPKKPDGTNDFSAEKPIDQRWTHNW